MRSRWRFFAVALGMPTLSSAVGIDGGAIFQIIAAVVEPRRSTTRAIGSRVLHRASCPCRSNSRRHDCRSGEPVCTCRCSSGSSRFQCWVLAALVAADVADDGRRHDRARRDGAGRDQPVGAARRPGSRSCIFALNSGARRVGELAWSCCGHGHRGGRRAGLRHRHRPAARAAARARRCGGRGADRRLVRVKPVPGPPGARGHLRATAVPRATSGSLPPAMSRLYLTLALVGLRHAAALPRALREVLWPSATPRGRSAPSSSGFVARRRSVAGDATADPAVRAQQGRVGSVARATFVMVVIRRAR